MEEREKKVGDVEPRSGRKRYKGLQGARRCKVQRRAQGAAERRCEVQERARGATERRNKRRKWEELLN